ncbi:MAG: hypothetical protein H7Y01_11825 [Ferruginibacter sp.]|nr:hypothetical protein [Chitinophagaceae bacterium]
MKTTLQFLAITACIFISAGCTSQPKEFKERKLVIASKETVRVKELDLTITNNGCGRKWTNSEERPYCELLIKYKDSTIHAGDDFNPVYIGNIEIDIDRMNPWGREEDSVPPGGCRLWVRKLAGR